MANIKKCPVIIKILENKRPAHPVIMRILAKAFASSPPATLQFAGQNQITLCVRGTSEDQNKLLTNRGETSRPSRRNILRPSRHKRRPHSHNLCYPPAVARP